MIALALAAAWYLTFPTHAARCAGCCESDTLSPLPLTAHDSLRVELRVRRQSPGWIALSSVLAAGNDAADVESWQELWPIVRADADLWWTREKSWQPGVRDSIRLPVSGDGRYSVLYAVRLGNRSCPVRRSLP